MNIKRIVEMEVEKNQLMVGDKIQIEGCQWKVLEIKDGKALIWKCTKIRDHVFNEDGSNIYEGSDIQKYVRSEFWLPDEMLKLVDGDFFLLTEDQILEYMPDELDRIATDEDDCTTWYWTASPGVGLGGRVRGIHPSGGVYGYYAYDSLGVAPACWINL